MAASILVFAGLVGLCEAINGLMISVNATTIFQQLDGGMQIGIGVLTIAVVSGAFLIYGRKTSS